LRLSFPISFCKIASVTGKGSRDISSDRTAYVNDYAESVLYPLVLGIHFLPPGLRWLTASKSGVVRVLSETLAARFSTAGGAPITLAIAKFSSELVVVEIALL
jgi:hypothetical protein